jgi:predicted nucleic acid-binding protein
VTRFFDASALVKRYVEEAGSATVRRLATSGTVAISRLSEIEIASAVERRVREGALTPEERGSIVAALSRDAAAMIVVELTPEIAGLARQLLGRHALRTGDAIQLATAVYLAGQLGRKPAFVAFDARLARAAAAEGLPVAGRRPPKRR